jgi:tripartite-type tricarboxylate transporter receptor subunit TctC
MKHLGAALAIALAASALPAGSACAQSYPSRPIRLLVPFAAGGAVDVLARLIAGKLSDSLGQSVIVENRPGAGGNIAADAVAKSAPDGYTLLQNTNGQAISPALYRNLPFDALGDFTPITQLVASNLILVASPKSEITSLKQLIALAKAKPGSLSYGSSGVGNPLHLTMEMLKITAGIDLVAVPYRGDAQINAALIAGEMQVAVVPLATARSLIENGQLRALAVTAARRAASLPDVPTVAEEGIAGFASTSWQGWFAPARTPREIVALIQREVATAVAAPDVAERLKAMSYEGVVSTPEDLGAYFRSEIAKFARIVREANIPMQE